ncbi:DgyrCDS8290 [Dimorphilus gyrociliatus]|uniref:DgyrCDS8290 n=1 Tax=Dimorphilus gyrociliatus TaxID=2664684 RepID=A0A7I8VTS1_9ANNE|nr:DgyrCDS8290 [Dimorphilus gyrociliatus]
MDRKDGSNHKETSEIWKQNEKQTDQEKSTAFGNMLERSLNATYLSMGLTLGGELGLFDRILEQDSLTCQELAEKSQTKQCFVNEWLGLMVSSGIIDCIPDSDPERYFIADYKKSSLQGQYSWLAWAKELSGYFKTYDTVSQCFKLSGPRGVDRNQLDAFYDFYENMDKESADKWSEMKSTFAQIPGLIQNFENGIEALDVGCGGGNIFISLALQFPKSTFYGVEISEKALQVARKNAENCGVKNIKFIVADATNLPKEWTGKFKYVHTSHVHHDSSRPRKVTSEIFRVLASKGSLSIFENGTNGRHGDKSSDPNYLMGYFISTFACVPNATYDEKAEEPLGVYVSKRTIIKMMEDCGFSASVVGGEDKSIESPVHNHGSTILHYHGLKN